MALFFWWMFPVLCLYICSVQCVQPHCVQPHWHIVGQFQCHKGLTITNHIQLQALSGSGKPDICLWWFFYTYCTCKCVLLQHLLNWSPSAQPCWRRRRWKVRENRIEQFSFLECGASDGMHTAGWETQRRLFIRTSSLPLTQHKTHSVSPAGSWPHCTHALWKCICHTKCSFFFKALFHKQPSTAVNRKERPRAPLPSPTSPTWPVLSWSRSALSRSGLTHFRGLGPKLPPWMITWTDDSCLGVALWLLASLRHTQNLIQRPRQFLETSFHFIHVEKKAQ